MEASGPNAEQIRYWNEAAGAKWISNQEQLDRQNAPLAEEAMDRLAIAPGQRVLDIGCGCGATTLELARRVGRDGHVTGIDISTAMLERARARAREQQLANADFLDADAQQYDFASTRFDLLFSRFGVMFFSDPVAAFANLRRALEPDGRLGLVCWQALDRNPWLHVPTVAVAPFVNIVRPPPGTPGPFAFADRTRVHSILEQAGFVDIEIGTIERSMIVGGAPDLESATDLATQFGPAGTAIRDASPEAVPVIRAAVRAALTPFLTPDGVRLDAALWFVRARRGA